MSVEESKSGLKCLYLNARSLCHKMHELFVVVEAVKPDVIGITETWGNEDIPDAEFSIPGFSLFRADRGGGRRGGGVLLLVNSCLNPVEVKLNSCFADQIWCKIKIRNRSELFIGICYRSPNIEFSNKDNDAMLCDMLTEVRGKPLLLMGDFNHPDIDWSLSHGQSPSDQNFVNCVDDGFLTQHVTEGTCNGAILDLVLTSEPDMIDKIDKISVLGQLSSSDQTC